MNNEQRNKCDRHRPLWTFKRQYLWQLKIHKIVFNLQGKSTSKVGAGTQKWVEMRCVRPDDKSSCQMSKHADVKAAAARRDCQGHIASRACEHLKREATSPTRRHEQLQFLFVHFHQKWNNTISFNLHICRMSQNCKMKPPQHWANDEAMAR